MVSRVGAGLAVSIAMLLSAACSGGAVTAKTGTCDQVVRGVDGRIYPETSRLTCEQIKAVIEVAPAAPGSFNAMAVNSNVRWMCHLFPKSAVRVLISCQHMDRQFAVRRSD